MTETYSILAADFGSVFTRAMLIDVVDGNYRLVARAEVRSTGGFPAGDVSLGLRQAIQRIAEQTGRTLLDKIGQIITPARADNSGVDHFIATASGGRSLRAILVGLMPGVSIESGLRAMEGTYVSVVDVLSLIDDRTDEEKLNAILLSEPDMIFITGGTENGAVQPLVRVLDIVQLAVHVAEPRRRPTILYAGNTRAADKLIKPMFEEVTRVVIADNVRPSLNEENLNSARLRIAQVFDRYKEAQGNGFDVVGDMSSIGLLPTAQSYQTIARYLGTAEPDLDGIAIVDIGSTASTLATFQRGATQETKSNIRTDLGLGHGAPQMIASLDPDQFRTWIPFSVARADLLNYALNKQARPTTIPMTRNDMYLEHALLRVAIAELVRVQRPEWLISPPKLDRIIGVGGALTNTGNPALSAMLLLDAIQPSGVIDLYTDPNSLIAAMGALSYLVPEAVVQLLDGNNLDRIGTAFCLDGTPNLRRRAANYRIEFDDGEVLDGNLNGGEFAVFDLPPGKTAKVRVRVQSTGNVSIGGKSSVRRVVEGSAGGIIIDTRGRPLPLKGVEIQRRMLQLILWYAQASGVEPLEVGEELLKPVQERSNIHPDMLMAAATRAQADPTQAEAPRRGGWFGGGGKRNKGGKAQTRTVEEQLSDSDDVLSMLEDDAPAAKPAKRGKDKGGKGGKKPEAQTPKKEELTLDDLLG